MWCTYPGCRGELRERCDVPRGHMAGQLEPVPADLLDADLLPFSYVKCGLHTGAGHHSWCSWSGDTCLRRAPYDISGTISARLVARSEQSDFLGSEHMFVFCIFYSTRQRNNDRGTAIASGCARPKMRL